MAEFDKVDIADAPVLNQSRSSEGFRGSTAIGSMFQAAGSALKQGATIADTAVKGYIQREATQEVDRIRDDYGVGAAVEFKTGLDNPRVLPEELNNAGDRLKMLRSAYMSNKLRESNYRAQLELASRQLRYRYPGYREEIDQMFTQITGNLPANALRASLMQEAEEDAAALRRSQGDEDSNAKRLNRQWDKAIEDGLPIPQSMYEKKAAGTLTLEEFQPWRNNQSALKYQNDAIKDNIETEEKQRDQRDSRFSDLFKTATHQRVTALVQGSTSVIANDQEKFKALMNRMREGKITKEDLQTAQMFAGKIRNAWEVEKAKLASEYAGTLPKEKLNEIAGGGDVWLNSFLSDLENGNTGFLNHHMNTVKIAQNAANYEVSKNVRGIEYISVLKDKLGPQLSDTILRNASVMSATQQQLDSFFLSKMVDGKKPVEDALAEMQKLSGGTLDAKQVDSLTNGAMQAAASTDTDETTTGTILDNLYGRGNGVNILKNIPQDKRPDFILKMVNPSYVKALENKRSAGTITQQQWDNYSKWVFDTATITLRSEASTANQIQNVRKNIKLQYDPKTYTLKTVARNEADPADADRSWIQRALSGAVEKGLEQTGRQSLDSINKLLIGAASIAKANGEDPNDVIPVLIEQIGINMTQARQPTAIDSIWDMARKAGKEWGLKKGLIKEDKTE